MTPRSTADCIELADLAEQLAAARRLGNDQRARELLADVRLIELHGAEDELTVGFMNLEMGEVAEALRSFGRASEHSPDLALAHSARALAHQLLGQPAPALDAVNRALALDPQESTALKVLARINLDMGLADCARAICQRILKSSPEDPDAVAMMEQAARVAAGFRAHSDSIFNAYEAYVSLGNNCEAGLQFQRIGYSESSFFRFTYSPYESTMALIASDFSGVFRRENLVCEATLAKDLKCNIAFHTKLPVEKDPESGNLKFRIDEEWEQIYQQELGKIRHLVGKWKSLVGSDRRVLYIVKYEGGEGKKRAGELLGLFERKYPGHRFNLLFVQPEHQREPDWELPRVINRYFPRFAPIDNAHDGDTGAWDRIFSEFPLTR